MKLLFVFLQFGASTTEPLSITQSMGFWGVILLLVALFIFFYIRTNKRVAETQKDAIDSVQEQKNVGHAVEDEEIAAAIALSIHMYKTELHDKESFTITLKKVSRIYSPWSSKIYTLRQNPR